MAFRHINFDEGKTVRRRAGAITIAKGDALVITSGLLALATSSTATDVQYIGAKAVTASSGDYVDVWACSPDMLWEADCDGVVSTVDIGTFADLATVSTINPDASSNDLFLIEDLVGVAETSTKVVGRFTREVTAS